MHSNIRRVKDKITKGDLVIGIGGVTVSDYEISEILCHCGFDFIWIDAEHGGMDKKDINTHIMAIRGLGVAPFVRVAWNDPVLVKPILEMGPAAIIFPSIKTVKDAKLAVRSCRYPPYGIRGFGPRRANDFSKMDNNKYLELSRSEPWVILQIEHIEGVNNLEDIIKVEGVNSIVVGPNDLSGSINLIGQTRHPKVVELLNKIGEICNKYNMPFGVGMGSSNKENILDWINRGISWVGLDTEYLILREAGEKIYKDTINLYQAIKG